MKTNNYLLYIVIDVEILLLLLLLLLLLPLPIQVKAEGQVLCDIVSQQLFILRLILSLSLSLKERGHSIQTSIQEVVVTIIHVVG